MRRHTRIQALKLEPLESRALLAGDVAVTVMNGNLLIQGDTESNQIAVHSANEPGAVFVAGLAGPDPTTVNGIAGPVRFDGVFHHVMIEMGTGDDEVRIGSLIVNGSVVVRLGEGDNTATVGLTPMNNSQAPAPQVRIGGHLVIQAGDGSDRVLVNRAFVEERLSIATGNGDDIVSVGQIESDPSSVSPNMAVRVGSDAFINLGSGNDRLLAGLLAVGSDLRAFSPAGDNVIRFGRVFVDGDAFIELGEGADIVLLNRFRAESLRVATGDGDDRARLLDSVLGNLYANMGSGDDQLAVGGIVVRGSTLLNGGSGNDTFLNLGNNRWRNPRIVDFGSNSASFNTNSDDESTADGPTNFLW